MNKLRDVLISFKDITSNTGKRDVCAISTLEAFKNSTKCTFAQFSDVDCDFCILDVKAKLDKPINILNKLGE